MKRVLASKLLERSRRR